MVFAPAVGDGGRGVGDAGDSRPTIGRRQDGRRNPTVAIRPLSSAARAAARSSSPRLEPFERGVTLDRDMVEIVHAGAAKSPVGNRKTRRLDNRGVDAKTRAGANYRPALAAISGSYSARAIGAADMSDAFVAIAALCHPRRDRPARPTAGRTGVGPANPGVSEARPLTATATTRRADRGRFASWRLWTTRGNDAT